MKKLTALILALITLLGASLTARADGAISDSWKGEVISMQVSLYNQASSSSGSSRKVKNGEEFYILSREGNWFYVAVPNDNGSYDYGYVMSYYVVENPTHIVLRNANGIYAYAAPYNTDKRVGTVSSYQRFTVIATTGNYYIVSFRNAVYRLPGQRRLHAVHRQHQQRQGVRLRQHPLRQGGHPARGRGGGCVLYPGWLCRHPLRQGNRLRRSQRPVPGLI